MYCTNAVKSTLYFATCYTLYSTILCRQILARILAIQPYAVVMQYSLSNLPSLFSDICIYAHLFFSSYVSCIHNRTFLLRTTTLLVILYAHTMHIFLDKRLEEQEILNYIMILYVPILMFCEAIDFDINRHITLQTYLIGNSCSTKLVCT